VNDWKYEAGKWEKIEAPFSWNEGEDLKVTLSRAGYYGFPSESFGEGDVEIYCREDDEPPWFISLTITDCCFSVFIYDEQSLLEWKAKYTPAYSLSGIANDIHDALDILSKAFRVWHGHSPSNVCAVCDPEAYRRQLELLQRKRDAQQSDTAKEEHD